MLSEKGRVESSTATGEELVETKADKNIGNCESQRQRETKEKRCWRTTSYRFYIVHQDIEKYKGHK